MNSLNEDSSRNTTDMIPDVIIKDERKILRKSNSMNPNAFKISLTKT